MNAIELKNGAIKWLEAQSRIVKKRPHPFTPKEVAEAVGGAYTLLGGNVAKQIVDELVRRGINIRYVNNTKPCKFELLPAKS